MEAAMKFANRAGVLTKLTSALFGLMLCAPAFAQYRDQAPDDDIRQTVARVSYLNGGVSYARGDDPDNWQSADLNVPLTLGDRIYTGRGGRAELSIHGGTYVRLDGDTDLEALNLTDDTQQLSLKLGTASFQLRRLGQDDVFEVDTPNAAITFDAAGDYRVDVDQDGNSRIVVRRGRALVAAGGGQVTIQSGDEMDINGLDDPRYDIVGLAGPDGFDRWVSVRAARVSRSRSRQYVSEDIVGVADLDDAGSWQDVPEYGRCWSPARVAVDWAPYRDGHWVWQDPWGWTWISTESWGWAPYHYGRWVTYSSRWYWVPDAPRTYARYSPALVAFVGGGPGVAVAAGGFVGWFPLAPRDPFNPWWGARRPAVEVRNVTYVNRTYVTVVRQDTFVSGGLVARAVVRDQQVVRNVIAAPVLRGPIPIVPTTASLRVAVRPDLPPPPRPPAAVIERAVVARVAPPPAPPVFAAKVDVIRQNQGAPVAPAAAARIIEQRGAVRPAAPIRPVVSEQGRMTLAPAQGTASTERARPASAAPVAAPQPVAVAPVRGREMATPQRVVAPVAPGGDARKIDRGLQAAPAQPAAPARPAAQAPGQNPTDRQREVERQRQELQQQQQQQQENRQRQDQQRNQQQQQQQQQQEQERRRIEQQQQQNQQRATQQEDQRKKDLERQQQLQQQQQQQQQQQENTRRQEVERQRVQQQQQQQQEDQRRKELEKQQQQQQQPQQQQQQQDNARRQELERQRQQQQQQQQDNAKQQQEQRRIEQEQRQKAIQQQQQQQQQRQQPTQPPQQDQQRRQEQERQRQPQPQPEQRQQQQPPPDRQRAQPPDDRQAPPKEKAQQDRGRQPEKKATPKDNKKDDQKKDEKQ
jgi:hypothetical protein